MVVRGACRGEHPKALDASCRLVAIPEEGQEDPRTWIYFSLEKQWLEGGDLYLEDLLERITLEDLVAIYAALVAPSADGFKDDGPDAATPSWPPGFFLPFPPGDALPRPPSASPASPPPSPPPAPWPPRNKWEYPVARPRHRPMNPARMRENGVDEADLHPWPPPYPGTDPTRHGWAAPGAFRCDGQVWSGYRSDCPDFSEDGPRPRWERTMQVFWKEKLFNGGKNPGCSEACAQAGHGGLVIGFVAGLGCIIVTGNPACLQTLNGGLAFATGSLSGAVIETWLVNRCQEAYCDAK